MLAVAPPFRILIAEDDESFLDAIALLLERDDRFVVAGRARNGREAVDARGGAGARRAS